MMELLGIPAWIETGMGLIGLGFALGGFARARQLGWRSSSDRTNGWLLLITSLAVAIIGGLRWMTGVSFIM